MYILNEGSPRQDYHFAFFHIYYTLVEPIISRLNILPGMSLNIHSFIHSFIELCLVPASVPQRV